MHKQIAHLATLLTPGGSELREAEDRGLWLHPGQVHAGARLDQTVSPAGL